jgi:phospholipase/lecithinase/hemolysin
MRPLRASVAAATVLLALAAPPACAQFTNIFYFGDSLTDSGTYSPVLPPGTGLYNTALIGGLDTIGGPTMRVNIFALFNELLANPGVFGFTNVTTPACGTTVSLLCTSANFVTPEAANAFVFADGVHPTTGAHAVIAELVASMIEGRARIGVIAEAPLAVERSAFRRRQRRLQALRDDGHRVRGVRRRALVGGHHARRRRSRLPRRPSRHPARHADSARERRYARLACDGQPARRLLVGLRRLAARAVRARRVGVRE